MATDTVICYEDRDNSFFVTLKINDVTLTEGQMDLLTKFEIKYSGVYYDSDDFPLAFVRDDENGTVQIKPVELGLVVGSDKTEFLVYDAGAYSNGLMWDQFKLKMKGDVTI
ncbi:MAG: hypothetical protein P9L97_06025 [Candidatus Tenebribacter davisii]|nr:hypothetical protein [Candidatus Tenebribacter davisii]